MLPPIPPMNVKDTDLAEYYRKIRMVREWLLANFEDNSPAEKTLISSQVENAKANPCRDFLAMGGADMCFALQHEFRDALEDGNPVVQEFVSMVKKLVEIAYSQDDSFLYSSQLKKEIQEIYEVAVDDARRTIEYGVSLNPYSTYGGRGLWQGGWDGVRPANLTDSSINWRYWMRGCQARVVADANPSSSENDGNQFVRERSVS